MLSFQRKLSFCAAALLVLLSCQASAASYLLNKPSRYVLPNGLTVILKDVKTKPLVCVQLWVKAGSSTEGERSGTGISHFIEHMLFKGTATRGVGEVERQIKALGGDINAFTSFDFTSYKTMLPKENLAGALDVLSDVLQNSTFDEAEFAKEREVILNEIRLNRDDPHRHLYKELYKEAYRVHPYGTPIIGEEELLKGLKREDLLDYYRKFYIPNNMILVVAGDIDIVQARKDIEKAFAGIPQKPLAPITVPKEPRRLAFSKTLLPYATQPAEAILAFQGVSIDDKDLYALDTMANILGSGESSRLEMELHRKKGLLYSASSWNSTPKYEGLFVIAMKLESSNLDSAADAVFAEIEKIKDRGVSREELEKAKKMVRKDYIFKHESMEEQAGELALNEIIAGDVNFSEIYLKGIESVTSKDIQDAARRHMDKNRAVLAALVPQGEVKEEAFAAEAAKEALIKKHTLPNGARVLIMENSSLPIVSLRASFSGGVRFESDSNNGISQLASRLLLKGTSMHTAEQIAKLIDSFGGDVSTESGNNSISISMNVLKEDFPQALKLLKELITSSSFPEAEFQKERDRLLADVATRDKDIFGSSVDALKELFFDKHPYRLRTLGKKESVSALKREDVAKFYQGLFVPNNMVLSMFGDVSSENALNEIEFLFKDMKELKIPDVIVEKSEKRTQPLYEERPMDKEEVLLIWGFDGPKLSDEDRYAIEALSSILSRGGGRIYAQIRDALGLSYTLGSFSVPGIDKGMYLFYVATVPEKIDEVKLRLKVIIDEVKTSPVSDEELESSKKELISHNRLSLETNEAVCAVATLDELYGLGFDNHKKYEDRINAVTKDDIMRAAKKYLDINSSATVLTLPAKRE